MTTLWPQARAARRLVRLGRARRPRRAPAAPSASTLSTGALTSRRASATCSRPRARSSTGCRPATAASRTSPRRRLDAQRHRRRLRRGGGHLRHRGRGQHHRPCTPSPAATPTGCARRPLELPPYVEYGGRATTPPPFLSEGGRMRGSCSRAMRSGSPTSSTACSTFPRAARRTTARWARTCCCSWAASSASPASPRRSTAGGRWRRSWPRSGSR